MLYCAAIAYVVNIFDVYHHLTPDCPPLKLASQVWAARSDILLHVFHFGWLTTQQKIILHYSTVQDFFFNFLNSIYSVLFFSNPIDYTVSVYKTYLESKYYNKEIKLFDHPNEKIQKIRKIKNWTIFNTFYE